MKQILLTAALLLAPGAALAEREQAAEAAIRGAVSRVANQARCIGQIKTGADEQAQPRLFRRDMRTDDARKRVAISDADG